MFYNSDSARGVVTSRGLFSRVSSAIQLSIGWKVVENSTEPTELDRVRPAREQEGASGLAGLEGLAGLSSMVGAFYVGQDFRRNPSRSTAPFPTPAPLAQRAGDVKVGGGALVRVPLEYNVGWRGTGATHCLGSGCDILLCPRISSGLLLEYVPFVLSP